MTIRVLPSSEELLGVLVGRVVPFSSVVPNILVQRCELQLRYFLRVSCGKRKRCAEVLVSVLCVRRPLAVWSKPTTQAGK